MSQEISRRTFLRGTLAGATVVAGFDTEITYLGERGRTRTHARAR